MAYKGQKHKKYDPKFIAKVVNDYKQTGGYTTIARKYNISWHTVATWIRKENKGLDPTISYRKGTVGRRKGIEIDYKERYEILKKYQAFLEARHEKK